MDETSKMALGMQMDVGRTSRRTWLSSQAEPWADPKHQAETSEPSWALSQAKPNHDSPANPQLSPKLNPEPSSELSQTEH